MIKIANLGYRYVNWGGIDVNRSHGTGDYLFLCFRCPTEVWLDGAYRLLPENTYFLYEKGAPQIYRKLDSNYINDWIHFDIEPYNHFFESLGIPFQTPMMLPDNSAISDMISDLFLEYFDTGKQHEIIIDQKASILFHKFSDLYRFSQKNGTKLIKYRRELIDMRKKLQNFEYQPKNVQELAAVLNISTSYLQHLYKEIFGISIQQDIIYGRIEHAAQLLNGTAYSVSEVARTVGYENIEHFSRQFKKIKGCSPSSYRKR
jgi:AraC family transcriptional regulator of arabinose operon